MADATTRPGGPADDEPVDEMDDDALADAILATFTSSIPIIRPAEPAPPAESVFEAPVFVAPAFVEPEPAPPVFTRSEPTPPEPAPPVFEPAAAAEPGDVEPDYAETPSGGKVWDLGDPITPVVEQAVPPEPVEEPWTRLVEPEEPTAESAEPTMSTTPPSDSAPGVGPGVGPQWAPPVWQPAEESVSPVDVPADSAGASAPTPWFDLSAAPPPNPSAVARHLPPPEAPVHRDAVAEPEPPAPSSGVATAWSDPAGYPPPVPPALVEPPAASAVWVPTAEAVTAPESGEADPAEESDAVPPSSAAEPAADSFDAPVEPVERVESAQEPVVEPSEPPAETGMIAQFGVSPLPPLTLSSPPDSAVEESGSPQHRSDPDDAEEANSAPRGRLPGVFSLETAGLEPTPSEQRVARSGRLFWTWIAANSSLLGLSVGGALIAMGMSVRQAIISAIGGIVLSFLPLGVSAIAGRASGQPTLVVSRAAFGLLGNVIPAALALVTRAIWGGILLWIGVDAAKAALVFAGVRLSSVSATLLGVGFVGLVSALLAITGFGLLARAQAVLGVVTAIIVVGVIALTAPKVELGAALRIADGPWVLVLSGVVLVFAFVGLGWAQSGSEVARYQSRRGSGASTSLLASLGAGLPPLVLVAWGSLLAASAPRFASAVATSPIAALQGLLPSWFPVPLLLLVLAAAIAGGALAFYSGGFALQATGIRVGRPVGALIAGVLSIGVAIGLEIWRVPAVATVRDILTTVAVPVAAWAGIFGIEVLTRSRRYETASLLRRGEGHPDVRIAHLITLVVAAAIGFGFTTATLPGLTWQGWFFPVLGVPASSPLASSDLGVLVAFVIAMLVPLVGALATARRPRMAGTAVDLG